MNTGFAELFIIQYDTVGGDVHIRLPGGKVLEREVRELKRATKI